jgi:hypothetical protein
MHWDSECISTTIDWRIISQGRVEISISDVSYRVELKSFALEDLFEILDS